MIANEDVVKGAKIEEVKKLQKDFESKKELANDAAKVVMTTLYGARFLCYDFL